MTLSTKLNTRVLLLALICSSFYSYGTHYTSINSGNWNNSSNWSTDGGASSCSCVPSTSLSGDTVTITHDIILTAHLIINNNAQLNVSSAGSLDGTGRRLSAIGGGEVNLSGASSFVRLTNGATNGTNGGTINVLGAIVHLAGPIRAYAGTINISGFLYQTTGNFQIGTNATVNLLNGAKFESFGGNINNEGNLDVCTDCCLTTSGNWTNESTGIVTGTGSATSTGGNMSNFGTFSAAITWCSVGADTGMPSAEDCSTSTGTCGLVMLPVELNHFNGAAMVDFNLLTWATQSESNCMNFTITTSEDGYFWESIGTIECAGNSTQENLYQFKDYDRSKAISYYRLEQVDVDGSIHFSEPISVTRNTDIKLQSYPNPVQVGQNIFISGMEGQGTVSIRSAQGTLVYTNATKLQDGESLTLNSSGFATGIYMVEFMNKTGVQTVRFIVQ